MMPLQTLSLPCLLTSQIRRLERLPVRQVCTVLNESTNSYMKTHLRQLYAKLSFKALQKKSFLYLAPGHSCWNKILAQNQFHTGIKIDFSLKKTSMIVVVHYRVWIKFAQKLWLRLVLCKNLPHKGVEKFQSLWVRHTHLAYIIQHCLWVGLQQTH